MGTPLHQLAACLSQTISPDKATRLQAEKYLETSQATPGYLILVLQLIESADSATLSVKQIAAVHFKNVVRKRWVANEDDEGTALVPPGDRKPIKDNLVQLMCNCPGGSSVKSQLSEAISLISKADFPKAWTNLLPDLIGKFSSTETSVIHGVLETISSILKRFRYVERSDVVYIDLKYVLELLQGPILALFQSTSNNATNPACPPATLPALLESLRLMCRIFFSLNWLDLPEYFEDHMKDWMDEFAKFLSYENPAIAVDEDEPEAGPIQKLQAAIIENINLYANRDEEPFHSFLPNFAQLVWNLLLKCKPQTNYDNLTTTSLKFLASIVAKKLHENLFSDPNTLRQIVSNIVIPNIAVRETDVEQFEDDPSDYILADMEGSDSETRRRCSIDLLRAMCRNYEQQATAIVKEHLQTLLTNFTTDPVNNWGQKDAAILLVLAVSVRRESAMGGVSEINDQLDVMEFFTSQILPELNEPNMSARPMLKADAVKFVSTFRNQFTVEHFRHLFPLLINHLRSPNIVVHTYAAAAIEKILTVKDKQTRQLTFGKTELRPSLEGMFGGFFAIIENTELSENEYVMKATMRALAVIKEEAVAVTEMIIGKLTGILGRVCKNPQNPHFNHYLFESIAVLVKSVCSTNTSYVSSFEKLLFPPFQHVLQMEVIEFIPYVFQVLAQLLEYSTGDLSPAYESLFAPLLTPTLWESKGNIPGLTRLICAYLAKAGKKLCIEGTFLMGVLGVFQKLISSKANEAYGFQLLGFLVENLGMQGLQNHIVEVFNILLMRLQKGKTVRYQRQICLFFSFLVSKCGASTWLQILNSIQPGLGEMLLQQVWIPCVLTESVFNKSDNKVMVVGMTMLMKEGAIVNLEGGKPWGQMVAGVLKLVASGVADDKKGTDDDDEIEVEISFDSSFSKLNFAAKPLSDRIPEVPDKEAMLAKTLGECCASKPGALVGLLQHTFKDPKVIEACGETKVGEILQQLVQKYNVNLS